MSAKYLCSDAKEFVEKRRDYFESVLRKAQLHGRDQCVAYQVAYQECVAHQLGCNQLLRFIADCEGAYEKPGYITAPSIFWSILFEKKITGHIVLYQNSFYHVSGPYDKEEAKLLVADSVKRKKQKVEYLAARKDIPDPELDYERMPIPESVRHEVWRRDKGRGLSNFTRR